MTDIYPNLTWALALNPKLGDILFEKYNSNTSYLSQLEKLILELKSLGCKGIQEEIKNVPNLSKFDSILSELEVAKILAKNGNNVTLLPDTYNQNKKSPDILCQNDIINSYIEVRRLSGNDYLFNSIILPLTDLLKDSHYGIDVKLKENLSIPKVRRDDRTDQEDLVKSSLREFEDKFKTNNLSEFPIVIDTTDIIFKIHKTISGNGYVKVSSKVITVPSKTLCEYVKKELIKKAIKRTAFEDIHRTYPYVVAFDCHEWSISTDEINQLLYGIITVFESPTNNSGEKEWGEIIKDKERNIPKWNEINAAKENGWSDLLIEKRLIPNNYAYLSEEGIFLSEQFMKNVSGVLFRKNNNISFYPNPFCSAEINYPDLQQRLQLV